MRIWSSKRNANFLDKENQCISKTVYCELSHHIQTFKKAVYLVVSAYTPNHIEFFGRNQTLCICEIDAPRVSV